MLPDSAPNDPGPENSSESNVPSIGVRNPSSQALQASQISTSGEYVVVARRYRPQAFGELIGQDHIAQALTNAIATCRVGHAYLFTGARGVGKTSSARIFAKSLNCVDGPTDKPCNQCEICEGISSGDDIDVIEIDGASNRGIDEIRTLRQYVGVRPSRARFKIYIIDEVHMLTREAFNALLKTLEEPPEHVKFIFCTTEPNKLPVTILSRCQRFDFVGIATDAIAKRLRQIVDAEGIEAENEALDILARRAAGSMRDSQSLLEQLLSFCPGKVTVDEVHGMLGTAGDERLVQLVMCLVNRDSAGAIGHFDATVQLGIDPAQLMEQLFGYFRDCMAAAAGCPPTAFLYASSGSQESVREVGKLMGLSTILAAMQLIDQTLSRMRVSTQGRILAELALVRMCQLGELDELSKLVAELRSAGPAAGDPMVSPVHRMRVQQPRETVTATVSSKQTEAPGGTSDTAGEEKPAAMPPREDVAVPISDPTALWRQATSSAKGVLQQHVKTFERIELAAPGRLVVHLPPGMGIVKTFCERAEIMAELVKCLSATAGRPVRVEFNLPAATPKSKSANGSLAAMPEISAATRYRRLAEVADAPMIQQAIELFGAEPTEVDDSARQKSETDSQ